MSVYKNEIVDIPKHSYSQKKGNTIYNYTYTEFYRNSEKKPRNKSVSTGVRITNKKGKMHPNDNYFSLMKIPQKRKETDVLNVGFTAVTEAGFGEIGLMEILSAAFGKTIATQIRSICAYMVREGCVMSYIDYFTRDEYFSRVDEILSSQRVSEIFAELTSDKMNDFYASWIPKVNSDHYICYDVTSVSTYSEMLLEAEYGYNRDHDKLPQMNIGLFTSEENKYPLYMFCYNGSVNDASNIVEACKNARTAGLDGKFKVVMDGGFFDDKKLNLLHSEELTFTVGMPAYLDCAKGYIDEFKETLYSPSYYLNHSGTYGRIVEDQEIFGIKGRVFVGLCTESAKLLNEDLDAKLERYESEISGIAWYKTVIKQKKYTSLFDFKKNEEGSGFSYVRNEEKINSVRSRFGYFVIFTTDIHATAQGIIDAYRDKDYDEKQFYDLKQYMGARRPRVHGQRTFDGKYAVLMIALIYRTWLKEKLRSYKTAHHLTLKRCMMKLSDIKMLVDSDEVRLLKSITAEQRALLEACSVDPDSLEATMREYILESERERLYTIKNSGI